MRPACVPVLPHPLESQRTAASLSDGPVLIDAETVLIGAVSETGPSPEEVHKHVIPHALVHDRRRLPNRSLLQGEENVLHGHPGRTAHVGSEFVEDGRERLPAHALVPHLKA